MEKQSTMSTNTGASGLTDADLAYFKKVTTHAYESWNQGDRKPYVERYTYDTVYMAPNSDAITGMEAIREYVMAYPDIKVEFPPEEIFGTANHANIRGTYVINDPEGNFLDKGKYLSVWQKSQEGQWNITHDIFNSDLPVPGADGSIPGE